MTVTEKKRKKKEWTDPFVDEIRKIRDEHAKEFNYDLQAISEDIYRKREELKKQGWTFVSQPSEIHSDLTEKNDKS